MPSLEAQPIQLSASPAVMVVVTAYNSPRALARCLDAVGAQTRLPDGILVVDNSDPLPADIAHAPDAIKARTRLLATGRNTGPAGGFSTGLSTFMDEGHWTHAWLMDDDCYPEPSALERLLAAANEMPRACLVFPTSINEISGVAENNPGWSGLLLDRAAVEVGGLPRADFFWWAEDTEYLQYRLPRKGVYVARAEDARVTYDLVRRADGRPPWKYYYEARNTAFYRLYIQEVTPRRLMKLVRTEVLLLGSALKGPQRLSKLAMFQRGLLDGVAKRLGIRVVPPVARRVDEDIHGRETP